MAKSSLLLLFTILLYSCMDSHPTMDDPSNIKLSEKSKTVTIPKKTDWKDSQGRTIWQRPGVIIDLLGDLSEKTVADLGAGLGYFSLRVVPHAKKVIAIDINKQYLNFIDSAKVGLNDTLKQKLETRLATESDPKIGLEEVDAVILVNTYIYIENRIEYFKALNKTFKPNGTIIIVDFKMRNIPSHIGAPSSKDKVPASQVELELLQSGYKNVIVDDRSLEYQYIIVATP